MPGACSRCWPSTGRAATFFTPGHTALAYPGAVAAVQAAGHEIAHHGWIHERPARLALDEERRALERGLTVLERQLGVRPRGYRAPGWDLSPHTVELLLEHGFEYDSSLMGNDYEPYWCRVGDVASPTEPFRFGTLAPLVELPVSWHLDDFPHFEFVNIPGTLTLSGGRDPASVLPMWVGEFDYLYEHARRGVLVLNLAPGGHRPGAPAADAAGLPRARVRPARGALHHVPGLRARVAGRPAPGAARGRGVRAPGVVP